MPEVLSQKDAIYLAIQKILESNNKTIDPTKQLVLEPKEKDQVISTVVLMFKKDMIELSESSKSKYSTSEKELVKYTKGLINNWIARDKRLNGKKSLEKNRHVGVVHELHYIKSKLVDPGEIKVMDDVISEYIDVSLVPSTVIEGT